jgi:hypothetical protein
MLVLSPGRVPRPTIPPPDVQRKAANPPPELLVPTTTEPSADTLLAPLLFPPGRKPRPVKDAPGLDAGTAVAKTANQRTLRSSLRMRRSLQEGFGHEE